ncbi:ferric reductase-like transmembrane domain-containing protein [Streptomyces sp. NPDC085942]|uniref:ferric reductase-like transmembrane domain-containing protein n=1 Tax=Streptomyces sp. NPDC085942 TaxID=3365743 RepID=UPI0037D0BB6B
MTNPPPAPDPAASAEPAGGAPPPTAGAADVPGSDAVSVPAVVTGPDAAPPATGPAPGHGPLPGPRAAGESGRPTGEPRRPTLRSDLRASWPDGLVALLVTAAVFVLLYLRIRDKSSSTVTVMPFMADAGGFWMYFLSQAFGWSALLWAWGTVVLGLMLSGPRPGRLPLSVPRLERLHRTTSLNTMALIAAHALLFAAELVRHDTAPWASAVATAFVEAFVPGGYDSGTGRVAVPVGQAALYLAIPLGLLFYVRHRIGPRAWRVLHRCVIVVYVLSVWHTLLYGTNVWYDGWFRTAVWLFQLPIAVLLLLRLTRPARRSEKLAARPGATAGDRTRWALRLGGRLLVAAVVVVLVAVVATGRDGGRSVPPEDTTSTHDHG